MRSSLRVHLYKRRFLVAATMAYARAVDLHSDAAPSDTEMLLVCKEKLVRKFRKFQEVDRWSLDNSQEAINVIIPRAT